MIRALARRDAPGIPLLPGSARQPSSISRTALVGLILLLSPLRDVRADLIYFQKGGEVQAPVAEQGESLVIGVSGEDYVFRPEDLKKRTPGFIPAEEWNDRRARALASGPDGRFTNAWWALENGLTDEAVAELKVVNQIEPGHAPTARMVAAITSLAAPRADPEFEAFRNALGTATEVERSPHILLLHQHSKAEAAERIAFLEQVVTSYYLLFAGSGIELHAPDRRLVFAWLADQKDYKAFLTAQGASVFASTRGYYHPTWNAVVAYDARSGEVHRQDKAALAARRDELKQFRETLDRLPTRARARVSLAGERTRTVDRTEGAALIDRLERDVRRGELLLEVQRKAVDDGMAAHEMIHVLAANSGLQPRHDAFPIWLQEGLAMQFEVVRGGRWAGISRAHDLRLPDWRKIQPPPRLESLARDKGFGQGYQRDPYVQAWALVYFLRARRPEQFITFLDILRSPGTPVGDAPVPPTRAFETFQRAFGADLDSLEREWHEFLSTTATPLERYSPDSASATKALPPGPNEYRE